MLDFELPAEWTDEDTAAVRAAFREHHLLLFREADLAPERQVALVRALGLAPDAWKDGKEYGLLSNTRPEAPNYGKHNPYLFHSDLTWKQTPIAAISLYTLVLPEASSPTDFANAVHARGDDPQRAARALRGAGSAVPHRLRRRRQPLLGGDRVAARPLGRSSWCSIRNRSAARSR